MFIQLSCSRDFTYIKINSIQKWQVLNVIWTRKIGKSRQSLTNPRVGWKRLEFHNHFCSKTINGACCVFYSVLFRWISSLYIRG
jgi:hypothetical protein